MEQGRHDELINLDGLYARLWCKQGGFSMTEDGSEAKVSVERLRDYPLFSKLADSDLSDLANLLLTVHYPGGAVVAAQGKGEERFFIIVRGKVKVERFGQEIVRLGEGDYFGETALLADLPAAATVTTLEPCVFLGLQPAIFAMFVKKTPALRRELEAALNRKLEATAARMTDITGSI
jgi:CRP-like cAMP-binding protein